MTDDLRKILIEWAETYNSPEFFKEDPIVFPARFAVLYRRGEASLADVEIAAIFSAHFAWGRRTMILRDCARLFDEMDWRPYDYVMRGDWKSDPASIHRTVKWSEVAAICGRLRDIYRGQSSLEKFSREDFRTKVYGQKADKNAPDKKINMMRRWMVRNDGIVDLGLWKDSDPASLLIPLDVHVHDMAMELGLTTRKQKDIVTVREITACFEDIFPGDPCKGDFSLFGYGVTHKEKAALPDIQKQSI